MRERAGQVTGDRWVGCRPKLYQYYLNYRSPQAWSAIALIRVGALRALGGVTVRERRKYPPILVPRGEGGWHFSWMGDIAAMQLKIHNWMHGEFDIPKFCEPERMKWRIAQGRDLFHKRPGVCWQVPLSDLPREVQDHPDRYAQYLLPPLKEAA